MTIQTSDELDTSQALVRSEKIDRKRHLPACFWTVLLYALILIANIISVYFIFDINPIHHIWSDPQRHWEQGIDTLRRDPMSMTDPVMFQLYIGILAKLTHEIPALVAFYTSALAVGGYWLWYRFFRELQDSRTVALVGWLAVSLSPSWTAIYGYFMQETLLIPALGAALYLSWRCKRKATLSAFSWMVAAWTFAGLTRGICIPLAAVVCTWLWFSQTQKASKAVYSLLILAFILGPLAYRSYHFLGFVAPHGVGDLSSIYTKSGKREIQIRYERQGAVWGYGFSNPSMGLQPFEPLSDWTGKREGVVHVQIDIDEGKRDWKLAHEENALNLERYLWITKENFIYIFFGPSWPDTNMDRFMEKASYHFRWIWFPLTIFALALTIVFRKNLHGKWMLGSLLVVWVFFQIILPISVNEGRYRKPFEGLLIAQLVLIAGNRRRYVEYAEEDIDNSEEQEAASESQPNDPVLTDV